MSPQRGVLAVRIAVVGYGAWGPNHVRNFVTLLGVANVIVVEADAERLARAVEQYPGIGVASDLADVLGDPTVDAVCVATPTHTHFTLTRDALKAGKHVLCEKPLAETGEESVELVDLARSSGRVLMVGFVFIHNPGIRALKTLIDEGDLGSVYYLSAVRANLGPIRDDVNAAFDLAAHDISIFNWLLDAEPVLVSALGGAFVQPGIEDVTFISLRYPDGVIAHIEASWLNPKKIRSITVVGSTKMVTWDDLELNTPVAIYDKGAAQAPETNDYGQFLRVAMWDNEIRLPRLTSAEPLRVQAEAFVDATTAENGRLPDGELAAGVGRVLDAVALSLKQDGAPIRPAGRAIPE